MADYKIGPPQPFPLLNALANSICVGMGNKNGVFFWTVTKTTSGDLMLDMMYLATTATTDVQLIADAKKYFAPMYLDGVRVCIKDGLSIIAMDLDLSLRSDPIADYDRAMAIVGK